MFALVPLPAFEPPAIGFVTSGSGIQYDSSDGAFTVSAEPTTFEVPPDANFFFFGNADIQIHLNNLGVLQAPVSGDGFTLTGSVDVDGDFVADFTGTLLTGEVTQFGFEDTGSMSDIFNFRVAITGGDLMSYFTEPGNENDFGITLTSENSDFIGSFATDFSGNPKGSGAGIDRFVEAEPASLSGIKYNDLAGDGPAGTNVPLGDVTINLYQDLNANMVLDGTEGDTPYLTTTTDDITGGYFFGPIPAGSYIVEEVVPPGYVAIGATSFAVTLDEGEHIETGFDFYNAALGSISGNKTVEFIECKCDKYGNPIQTLVTQNHAGVTINLYKDDGDGVFDAGDTLVDSDETDTNGNYVFEGLVPGLYFVEEVLTDGYVALDDVVVAASVTSGAHVPDIDFRNKLVKGSIGNYFFIDYNGNGYQDTDDAGVNGVTVKLLDSSGDTIATTVTADDGAGNNGFYLFYNLNAGNYFVEFVVPTGVSFTTKDAGGNEALDSDANANGRTDVIILGANEHIRTVDAGVKAEVCVENVVYKVKDYFDKCQQSKAGTIKGVTLEYNDGTDELFVQVTVASYNGRMADGFTIVLDDGSSIGDKAGTHAVFYFDATGANPILNVLAYNGDQDGSSIRDSNGYTKTYDPDRVATSLDNSSGWVKELTVTGSSSKKVFTFRVDVGAINDHVPLRNINWQGSEIGKYASFLVDTYDGLTTKYDAEGFLTKWSYCYHGWMDACQIKTQKCTVKECIAIDEMFAEWGWETSAYTGADGDPLADWDWAGSKAASCKCDDDHDPCKPRKDKDCDDHKRDDWDCFKDFGRKLSGRC